MWEHLPPDVFSTVEERADLEAKASDLSLDRPTNLTSGYEQRATDRRSESCASSHMHMHSNVENTDSFVYGTKAITEFGHNLVIGLTEEDT